MLQEGRWSQIDDLGQKRNGSTTDNAADYVKAAILQHEVLSKSFMFLGDVLVRESIKFSIKAEI